VALNALFFRMFPALASPREAVGIASSTWFLVGVFLAYALFPMRVAVPGILVLALADPAAGTIGRLYGKRRLGQGTWAGSAAFLGVAFAVLALHLGPAAGLAAALLVTTVEVVPWRLDDNLTVPVAAAFAAWIVGG
jgi:dolichol kinase